MSLPIERIIPELLDQLAQHQTMIVQAPPGAGKTTRVPLALLEVIPDNQRLLLIQPRRLAVYNAALYMSNCLNEPLGKTIGIRTRYETRVSRETRIEVITEGIFLRIIQNQPDLENIHTVIFDEFHERSVNLDLGLAFALDCQQAYRETDNPLHLLVMSATLNGEQLAKWLDAPWLHCEGRCFPVTTHYAPKPHNLTVEQHTAKVILQALANHPSGSLLVFLPGMKEIKLVSRLLEEPLAQQQISLFPLHASLSPAQQQAAIRPMPEGQRKVVLSTNVAETSVTIEGIEVVIDSGLVNLACYDERAGMNRLRTERISQAASEQRRGRAGRVAEGSCYRLWSESEQARMQAAPPPQLMRSDLLPVALELAQWGCTELTQLQLLDPPEANAYRRAQDLLKHMNLINHQNQITTLGRQVNRLGLTPRLGLLILLAEDCYRDAALATAAILSEGDPLQSAQPFATACLSMRLKELSESNHHQNIRKNTWNRIIRLCQQLAQRIGHEFDPNQLAATNWQALGQALCRAFPDFIAQQRSPQSEQYKLTSGKGARLNPEDRLLGQRYLVVLTCSGSSATPLIRLAHSIDRHDIEQAMDGHIEITDCVEWDLQHQKVISEIQIRLGALVLERKPTPHEDPIAIQNCLLNGIKLSGLSELPWTDQDKALRERLNWLHQQLPDSWPSFSDQALTDCTEDWLAPFLGAARSLQELTGFSLSEALLTRIAWDQRRRLDELAPEHWKLPTGRLTPIHYSLTKPPTVRAKLQECYGIKAHPLLANGIPIVFELLSPAQRPIQVTQDLPAFWKSSYHEIAKEMRGRYPKHLWPDDPANTQPTSKTKKALDQSNKQKI